MKIDLHCHSSFSDGIFSPQQLLEIAEKESLSIFSITDHDSVKGTAIANRGSANYSFSYITGIEISARYKKEKIEILGYNFNADNSSFKQSLIKLQNARRDRIYKILAKLQEIGLDITYNDVIKEVGDASSPGRPHFARAMKTKGYVISVKEAFNEYLAEGRPAYVPRLTIEPKEAIQRINKASGIAVLPHPLFVEKHDLKRMEELLDMLISWGMKGIEVYYNYEYAFSNFSAKKIQEVTKFLLGYCKQNDLLVTGGSDFHGDKGTLGEMYVPKEYILQIQSFFNL
ncbi:MAG: PHP domain-containing protein [Candidatus Heimdallarchaeaceae archaeon]